MIGPVLILNSRSSLRIRPVKKGQETGTGEVVPEAAPPAEELEEIEVPVPEPVGTVTTSGGELEEWEGAVISSEGEPPALESQPLPGTVKEIKAAVIGADLDTLLSWLREEQDNKKRKTAFEAIENALEENSS